MSLVARRCQIRLRKRKVAEWFLPANGVGKQEDQSPITSANSANSGKGHIVKGP